MSLPTSGLILNLDAQDISSTDGTNQASWADSSGAGNNVSGGTGNFVYKTNIINGHPVVRIDTANNYRVMTGAESAFDLNTSYTMMFFGAVKSGSMCGKNDFTVATSSDARRKLQLTKYGHLSGRDGYAINMYGHGAGPNRFISYVVRVTNATTYKQWINSKSYNSDQGTTGTLEVATGNNVQFAVGRPSAGTSGEGMIGDIGQLCIWNRALSDSEIDDVHNYVNSHWGITMNWPQGGLAVPLYMTDPSKLVMWIDAEESANNLTDNVDITSMSNLGGTAVSTLDPGSTSCKYRTGQLNSLAGLTFNGSSQFAQFTTESEFDLTAGFTIIVVGKSTTGTGPAFSKGDNIGDNPSHRLYSTYLHSGAFQHGGDADFADGGVAGTSNTMSVRAIRMVSATDVKNAGGTSSFTGFTAMTLHGTIRYANSNNQRAVLGKTFETNAAEFMTGTICAVLVFSGAPDATELENLMKGIGYRYGFSWGVAPPDPIKLQTVTSSLVMSQEVLRGIGIERTADAIKTRIGFGGRQTIRIGSRIYTVAVDSGHTYVMYSDDAGVTWTTEQITAWAAVGASICQGAGSQPVLLLSRSTDNALYPYLRNSGGGWTHKTNVGTSATNGPEGHQIMYDGTNYHLVYSYTHSTNHHRYVRHAVSAALSSYTYTYVDVGGTSGIGAEDSRGLAACMDGDGNIHMIWVGVNSGVYTLEYAKRTSGTWAAGEVIESFGAARPIYLSIATDSNKKPHITGTRTQAGVQNVFYRERTGSSWSASEYVASDAGPQTWPSLGFEDRQYPVIVFSWNQAGNTVHRYTKKSGVWGHQVVASDSTATKTEQLYDPYRNASVTLQGSFIVFQSSIMLFVTSLIIYGDAAAASGTAVLSQTIQIHGRDRVTHSISMSSIVSDPGHAYSKSVGGSDTYATLSMSQAVAKVSNRPRGATQSAFMSQGVDVAWVDSVGGFTTYSKTVQSNLSMAQQVVGFKTRVISITHTVNMSQVGPGLTRFKEVVQDLELNQIVDRVRISNLTVGPQSLTMSQVIGLNKSLNLGVTHNVALQQGAARIRAWVWNSTHYNPGWAAEYESDINDFVILGPSEAPTVEMTLPRPDWGDQDNLKWRPTAVRRNRSGQARVFKVPVYEELKVKFVGLMRKRAAEFRACIAALVGNNVRIRDQNGAWKDVVITSSTVTATQGGPESVTVEIEFEQKDKVA